MHRNSVRQLCSILFNNFVEDSSAVPRPANEHPESREFRRITDDGVKRKKRNVEGGGGRGEGSH